MGSAIARQAEELLATQFESIGTTTQYIRAFRTSRGRELAIERDRDSIYVWTEQAPDRPLELPTPQAYPPAKSRNSNLSGRARRIEAGKPAYYWHLETSAQLAALCDWYKAA